jgi:dolichyl-phosphate beta-glucosyltransferase
MVTVSVILPFYNESRCINETFDSVLEYSRNHKSYQFIFVDDGSKDRTVEILSKRIAGRSSEQFKLLSYPANRGKGYAVRVGARHATGQYVCFIDGDLAYSLDHLDLLVSKLEKFDVAIGCRNLVPESLKQPKLTRRISGFIFNWVSRKILNLPYLDMQAGLKGFRDYVAKELFEKQQLLGFAFDVELIYLAKKYDYCIGEVPARVSKKHRQKVSNIDLLKDSALMFVDLLKIKLADECHLYD